MKKTPCIFPVVDIAQISQSAATVERWAMSVGLSLIVPG